MGLDLECFHTVPKLTPQDLTLGFAETGEK